MYFLLCRFKNVMFEICSTVQSGVFDVSAKFLGVKMDSVQLVFQVRLMEQAPFHMIGLQ